MANQTAGLLSGLAAGLNSGLDAYYKADERKRQIADREEERRLKKEMLAKQIADQETDLFTKGVTKDKTTGLLGYTPEKQSELETERRFKEAQTKKYEAEAKTAGTKKPGDPQLKAATDLRKEFQGRPLVKEANTIKTAYNKITKAAKTPSAAGDMSMIFGYMKLLDPNSTVREGEYASAEQARGIPEEILGAYNKAKEGQRLTDKQRKDFLNQAKNVYNAQVEELQGVETEFGSLADRYGVDRGLIYQPTGLLKDETRTASPDDEAALKWLEQNSQSPDAPGVIKRLKAKGLL